MKHAVVVLIVLIVSGCTTPLGLNFQRSSLRGSGDMSTTAVLEYTDAAQVPNQKAQIQKYAKELLEFIETGECAKLPIADLDRELKEIVPAEFYFLVDSVIGYIAGKVVDVSGAIGEENVKRIKAGLIGIIMGAEKYDLKDRPPET